MHESQKNIGIATVTIYFTIFLEQEISYTVTTSIRIVLQKDCTLA